MYHKCAIDRMCIFYSMKLLLTFCFVLLLSFPLWAESEETSAEESRAILEEELALVRDTYLSALTSAMEKTMETAPDHWFNMRAEGQYATWDDFEIEVPSVMNFEVVEALYGFSIKSKNTEAKGSCNVRVVTRDADIFYDIDFAKGASENFRTLVRNVFTNDRAIFYEEDTPCTRAAVSCLNEYEMGTLGKSYKKGPKTIKNVKNAR